MLLIYGRQCEKTVQENSRVIMGDGSRVPIKDVRVGDTVATMLGDGSTMSVGRVVWKSRRYRKECLEITTAFGHSPTLGVTHPVRQWGNWTPAGDLSVGGRIASVRRLRDYPSLRKFSSEEVAFIGFFIADGGSTHNISFVQDVDSDCLTEFLRVVGELGFSYKKYAKAVGNSVDVRFSQAKGSGARRLLESVGLYRKGSRSKALPADLMKLSADQTKVLLESMWACDGHVSKVGYEVSYSTISPHLAEQVQTLLWKIGIPSRVRSFVPTLYKGTDQLAYSVHVRTRRGVCAFMEELRVPGKTLHPLPDATNDNRDTIPLAFSEDIAALVDTRERVYGADSLCAAGLRVTPKYSLTARKFRQYVDHFREAGGYDGSLVDRLIPHLSSDLVWDVVKSIEPKGDQWCYDLEVEGTHSFVVEGVVTHNSTTIGNNLLALSNLCPYLRSLYISASDVQMREFSDERLRAVIHDSPRLLALTRSTEGRREVQNVQTKRWKNQSKIILRSVYRSADRVRGISTDLLGVDELQDIYTDTLPVIEETQFASDIEGGPISIYAGTPKTFDNSLEVYWSRWSTQNEWMTRCPGCRTWVTAEMENIGAAGLECLKCSTALNPLLGQWVRLGKDGAPWEGLRVPQPVVLYAYAHRPDVFKRRWEDLLLKKSKYSRSKFQNEVMARSYDSGSKPVSFEEVRRCSLPGEKFVELADITQALRSTITWAGIDWGTGDNGFNILSIWKYSLSGVFTCIFAKRYEGVESDPDFSVQDMIRICKAFNVSRIGSDWGFGFLSNAHLKKAFGAQRVVTYAHTGSQRDKVRWDKSGGKFTTHRTRVLADLFKLIKIGPVSGGIAFPNWTDFETYADDILCVYQEFSERRREIVYDHPAGTPDDFLHTACYAFLVSQFDHQRPDMHDPRPGQKFKR